MGTNFLVVDTARDGNITGEAIALIILRLWRGGGDRRGRKATSSDGARGEEAVRKPKVIQLDSYHNPIVVIYLVLMKRITPCSASLRSTQ